MSAKRGDLRRSTITSGISGSPYAARRRKIMNDLIETVRAGRLTQIYFDRFEGTAHKARARMARNCNHGTAAGVVYLGSDGVYDCALMIAWVNRAGSGGEI